MCIPYILARIIMYNSRLSPPPTVPLPKKVSSESGHQGEFPPRDSPPPTEQNRGRQPQGLFRLLPINNMATPHQSVSQQSTSPKHPTPRHSITYKSNIA